MVTFINGETTTFADKTFLECMFLLWTPMFEKLVPMKITFPETGKLLYPDKDLFNAFIQGDIELKEVIEITECDGLYRNKIALGNDRYIDPGSLWKKKKNMLELVGWDYTIAEFTDDPEVWELI